VKFRQYLLRAHCCGVSLITSTSAALLLVSQGTIHFLRQAIANITRVCHCECVAREATSTQLMYMTTHNNRSR